MVAGGGRVRVYDATLRRMYDECWGGEVRGLEGVKLVGGRAGCVVGFGGKVSRGYDWNAVKMGRATTDRSVEAGETNAAVKDGAAYSC